MWQEFKMFLILFFIIALIFEARDTMSLADKDLSSQKAHRQTVSTSTFRAQSLAHDSKHRQFNALSILSSEDLSRASNMASLNSHPSNHHGFPNIEGLASDLLSEVANFPISSLIQKIHLLEITNDKVFIVASNSLNTLQRLSNDGSFEILKAFGSNIRLVVSGGGYVAAMEEADDKTVYVWDEDGNELSTIVETGSIVDVTVNEENSGTVFIVSNNRLKTYQSDGTFVTDLPNFGNLTLFATGENEDVYVYDPTALNILTQEADESFLKVTSDAGGSPLGLYQKSLVKSNKHYALTSSGGLEFVSLIDFNDLSDIQSGFYYPRDVNFDPPIYFPVDFAVSDTAIALIRRQNVLFNPTIIVWRNLDASTFPTSFGVKVLGDNHIDYSLTAPVTGDGYTESFRLIEGGSDRFVAFRRTFQRPVEQVQGMQSYSDIDGSVISTFTLPTNDEILHLATSDGDKVFAVSSADQTEILSWPNTGGASTAFAQKTSGNIVKLKAEGTYVVAINADEVDVWTTSGSHVRTITAPANLVDVGINNGFVYAATSSQYYKYNISTGELVLTAPTIPGTINKITTSKKSGAGNPLIYIYKDEATIEAVSPDTGQTVGTGTVPEPVQDMVSAQVGSNDLLYVTHGNTIRMINGGTDSAINNPYSIVSTPTEIKQLGVTTDGTIFAGLKGKEIYGWSSDGSSSTELSLFPFILPGIFKRMSYEDNIFFLHEISIKAAIA